MTSWLSPRDLVRHGLQVAAFCCVVAVFTTLIWQGSYGRQLVHSLSIGLLIWLVIEFGRLLVPQRYCHPASDGGPGWPMGWRGVALTAVAIGVGFSAGSWLAMRLLGEAPGQPQRDLLLGLMVSAVAGGVASFYFHARGKTAALAAKIARAERDASDAHLMLLQSQLEPHMLFNTLANLRALIAADPAAAQRMLDHLNAYLRAMLGASRATWHPLAAEFERLRDYLMLMQVRMGARLRFTLELPEALAQSPVPTLILQPLVENAIRHGLEPRVAGGEITVRAERVGERLRLAVHDTGMGLGSAPPPDAPALGPASGGFGLTQVRERLNTLFGDQASMTLIAAKPHGTSASIEFPLQTP